MGAQFASLTAYAVATTFTPGPNNILLLSCASTYGFRRCLPLLTGIWTGLITVMLLCGFGCGFLGTLAPQIVPAAKFAGAGYVLYLAVQTLRREGGSGSEAREPPSCLHGFLLQFLNVKILMLGITAYTGFILPLGFHPLTSLLYALLMTACAAGGNLLWATAGTVLFPLYRRFRRPVNAVMALLLVWCAWRIARV